MKFKISVPVLAAISIVAAAGIALAASLPPRNATSPVPQPGGPAAAVPLAPAALAPGVGWVLRSSIFRSSNSVVATAGGFHPIHPAPGVLVTCPGPGGCLFEVDQHIQVGNSAAAGNRFAVCSQIDGAFLSQPNCPFMGIVPTSGFVTGAFMQFKFTVNPGNHQVQTFLYTDGAASRAIASTAHRVYKP